MQSAMAVATRNDIEKVAQKFALLKLATATASKTPTKKANGLTASGQKSKASATSMISRIRKIKCFGVNLDSFRFFCGILLLTVGGLASGEIK